MLANTEGVLSFPKNTPLKQRRVPLPWGFSLLWGSLSLQRGPLLAELSGQGTLAPLRDPQSWGQRS